MGLMDKFSAGIERAAQEADKAFEKSKAKVGELQTEMQMDGLAKKLGYLVFDFYRGREVDQVLRQKYLDDMTRLEDQLTQARAAAAAKKEADAAARAARSEQGQWTPPDGPGASDAGEGAVQSGTTGETPQT
jgi:multidrug efflux pump subunit AcrA (membrane-fusion protein)